MFLLVAYARWTQLNLCGSLQVLDCGYLYLPCLLYFNSLKTELRTVFIITTVFTLAFAREYFI